MHSASILSGHENPDAHEYSSSTYTSSTQEYRQKPSEYEGVVVGAAVVVVVVVVRYVGGSHGNVKMDPSAKHAFPTLSHVQPAMQSCEINVNIPFIQSRSQHPQSGAAVVYSGIHREAYVEHTSSSEQLPGGSGHVQPVEHGD